MENASVTGLHSDNYVVIQGWMCNELNLKGNDLLVFALIYGFSQDGKSKFVGGRKYIANTFNISLPTVDMALQELLSRELIIKDSSNDHIHPDAYATAGSKETLLGVVKKLYQGGKEILPNNIDNKLEDNIDNSTNVELEQSTTTPNSTHTKRRALLTDTVNTTTSNIKENKKVKKKNLYEKCVEKIEEYTVDTNIKELLTSYLKVRLIRKDIPFNATSFAGMLKKLDTLTEDINEKKQIIQQAIDRVYPTFYPLHKPNYNKNRDVFSEYGQVKTGGDMTEAISDEIF